MYSDPALIRRNVVKLSLNDREDELLHALCNFTGEQKAVLLREMIIQRASEIMGHEPNSHSVAG